MTDEIIKPGDSPDDLPPEVLKQLQQEAGVQLVKAQRVAKEFVRRMQKEFGPLGAGDFLAILGSTLTDVLAETLVALDEYKLQPLDKSIPLFTQRLVREIQKQQEKAKGDEIVVARNTPPSRN